MTTNATETIELIQDKLQRLWKENDKLAEIDDEAMHARYAYGLKLLGKVSGILTETHGAIVNEVEARAK